MAKKSKKTKREKKISGKIDSLVMVLYALVIAAAVIRELMDRKRGDTQSEQGTKDNHGL